MKERTRFATYAVTLVALLAAATILWRNELQLKHPAPSESGYVEGWFACKAHPGYLCTEDGKVKPNPNWKGEREPFPFKQPGPLPPGPEK